MTTNERDRSKSDQQLAGGTIWVAQLLCFVAVISALAMGVLITLLAVSTSLGTTAKIAVYSGIVISGWCSISFLLGAVIAAVSAV